MFPHCVFEHEPKIIDMTKVVNGVFSWLTQCDDQDASIKYFEHSSFASKPCKSKHNAVSI